MANAELKTDKKTLDELFSEATSDASNSMSNWTNGKIELSLEKVQQLPLEEVFCEFDFGMDLLTMVVLTLDEEIGGTIILTFDEENGRQLASNLLCRAPATEQDWTPLEKSALCETGNILACSYVSALNRVLEQQLTPSPPSFLQDFGASVLEQSMMEQASTCDNIMICRTLFHREGQKLDWNVFFVPNHGMREALAEAIQM